MEAQRRQELLARKAVLASRRKAASALVPTTPTSPPAKLAVIDRPVEDVMMGEAQPPRPRVLEASVDDFLNSIGSMSGPIGYAAVQVNDFGQRTHSPDAMDVEESQANASAPDMTQSTPTAAGADTGTLAPPISLSSGSQSPSIDGPERRGMKRPVAADFDTNGSSKRTPVSSPSPGSFKAQPQVRKTGSFAGVSGPRRCVINLSDDEGEYEEEEDARPVPITPNPIARVLADGRKATMSPRLVETEKKIQELRDRIAKSEAVRLKVASSVSEWRLSSS